MNRFNRSALLGGLCLAAFSTPAFAQDAAPPQDAAVAAPTDVGEIIVTATRRAERLQDVPIAVSAVTSQQLAATGFKDLTNIQYSFPSVQFGQTPNDAGFRIRGVGTLGGFTSSSELPVGLVVDNVVIGFGNPVQSLGDLERIEVLKGPQGTQFGKNASSGVINITTKRPDMDKVSGSLFGSYGSLNERDIHGSVNLPLGKTAALAIYAFDREFDGYVDNVVRNEKWGGQHNYGGRAKLLWEPSDALSIYVIGDYSKTKTKGPGQLWTLNHLDANLTAPGGLVGLPFVNLAALGVTINEHNDKSIDDGAGYSSVEYYGASLQADLKLGDYTLTSITAFREQKEGAFAFSIDGLPYEKFYARDPGQTRRSYSQELRVTSPSGQALEFIAGAFASRQETGIGLGQSAILRPAMPYSTFPTVSITAGYNHTDTTTNSIAGYLDGKFHVSDTFALLGGLRLTHDSVTSHNYSTVDPDLAPFVPPMPSNGFTPSGTVPYATRDFTTGKTKATKLSGRAGAEFKPSRDLLFYATYARGYLGPTVTFSGLTGTRSNVKPQQVDDVTVGAKMQFLDRALTVNVNAFWDKYKQLQTSVFNGQEFLTENAGAAEAKGFEVELVMRPTRSLSFNVSYTYSDAKFTDYLTACTDYQNRTGLAATVCDSSSGTSLYQAAGEALPGAPKHAVTAGVSYEQPIGDALKFDFAMNSSLRSDVSYAVGDPYQHQDGYVIVNGNIGLGSINDRWRVGAFVRNLFKQDFNAAVISLPFTSGGYVNWRTREAERTFGVSLETKF
ncbi:TonB-dependent receptor [Novosphingobium olei]|uniref:TonB-dependent receptor n=1 Tax=Novosphingobium olei TaxID=2728851 RepID=UPI003088AF30|nr:TonB-dependent receptor [Novosphingobium olei]